MKFKVGDRVIRIAEEHNGMVVGDTDIIIKAEEVYYGTKLDLQKFGAGHADYNFISQAEINEQKLKKVLGL